MKVAILICVECFFGGRKHIEINVMMECCWKACQTRMILMCNEAYGCICMVHVGTMQMLQFKCTRLTSIISKANPLNLFSFFSSFFIFFVELHY